MMVDYHMWPWFERLPALQELTGEVMVDPKLFPKLQRWMEAMLKAPAVRESWLPASLHMQFMMSFATGTPNYDAGLTAPL